MKTRKLLVVVGALSTFSGQSMAEPKAADKKHAGDAATKRTAGETSPWANYDAVIETLGKDGVKITVKGVKPKSDGKPDNRAITTGGDELASLIDDIKSYRTKLSDEACKEDEASKRLGKIIDDYMANLNAGLQDQSVEETSDPTGAGQPGKKPTARKVSRKADEKALIAYTSQLKKFFAEKASKLSEQKDLFTESDAKMERWLEKLEHALWGGKGEIIEDEEKILSDNKARQELFAEADLKKDEALGKLVTATNLAIKRLDKDKVCRLDAEKPAAEETASTIPVVTVPSANGGVPQPSGTAAGPGGAAGGAGANTGGNGNNGDATASQQRAFADLQRQLGDQAALDELNSFGIDDEERDLIRDLARGQGSRVGGSRENTEGSPALTLPGIQTGGQGGQQQPFVPPQMPNYQQPEPMNPYMMMGGQPAAQQPQIIGLDQLLPKNTQANTSKPIPPELSTQQLQQMAAQNDLLIKQLQAQRGLAPGNGLTVANSSQGRRRVFSGRLRRSGRAPARLAGKSVAGKSANRRPSRLSR